MRKQGIMVLNAEIAPNIIIFEQKELPEGWKEGDMFKVVIGANGQVTLIKSTKDGVM
jgi:hypothetical protein